MRFKITAAGVLVSIEGGLTTPFTSRNVEMETTDAAEVIVGGRENQMKPSIGRALPEIFPSAFSAFA